MPSLFGKKKLELDDFVRAVYLTSVNTAISHSVNSLQQNIERNKPQIDFSIQQTEFELFILFDAIGQKIARALVKGFDSAIPPEQALASYLILKEEIERRFCGIELDPIWLQDLDFVNGEIERNQRYVSHYWAKKSKEYDEAEAMYYRLKLGRENLPRILGPIFFLRQEESIGSLCGRIAETYDTFTVYMTDFISKQAKRFEVVCTSH